MAPSKEPNGKYTILIAEDELMNFFVLKAMLTINNPGLEIIHAADGVEAVEICMENKTINLVLMDLKMPRMTGFEATKKIKDIRPDLPIVIQTAYSSDESRREAMAIGCDDFITKPIYPEILDAIMNRFFKGYKVSNR